LTVIYSPAARRGRYTGDVVIESLAWRVVSSPLRPVALRDTGRRIDVPVAFLTWLSAWLLGQVVALIVYSAGGYEDVDEVPIWLLFVTQLLVWSIFIAAMVVASRREGSGRFQADYQASARAVDLVGVPIGVLTQLVLVPLVYLPLERLWEDVFTEERLTETAKDLVDRASGGSMVLLVLMVCIGAPIVEELVYRGLLQGSFAARFNQLPALLGASTLFMLIHFRPVEYPGLLVIGLVCGACALATGRLGMAIACHVGFNATGLLLALD
jgi:membrane protease YdiL (CAAX protease family)